jgi:DNA mismatch repair protein MutS2
LKTVGLLTAMAMCGLMIPAAEGSIISVMSNILTDIGDKQSIEASLSTFSSHMVTIADILKKADERTLVLLDEPGTGTDPVEGAALAESIFEELKYRHSLVMATTHYQELKIYAENEDSVQNASCEFDNETFRPTYKLKIGSPGKSNAFDIASGLGFPEHIISHARLLISDDNSKFEDAVAKLENTQKELERKEKIIEEERAKIVKLREELENEKRILEEKRENELDKARGIASQIIEQTKAESNALIDELETLRKAKEKKDFSQQVSNAKSSSRSTLNRMYDNANPVSLKENDENYVLPRKLRQGDSVYVTDIGKSGIIAGKPDDSNQVWVQVGIMKTRVDISKIRLEEKKPTVSTAPKMRQRKTPTNNNNNNSKKAVRSGSMELDIRGYASDEGCYEMESFIDRAIMSGLHTVTIIHGKGTGVLRTAIRQRLRSMKSVKSFRPGVYGEGEDGVTVVELN